MVNAKVGVAMAPRARPIKPPLCNTAMMATSVSVVYDILLITANKKWTTQINVTFERTSDFGIASLAKQANVSFEQNNLTLFSNFPKF